MTSWLNIKATTIVVIALLLSACGYQLQKPLVVEANTQPVYVEGDRLISLALKQQLRSNGIQIAKTTSAANSVITVAVINTDNRSYSVSADARDAEILRSMTASIEWHHRAAKKNSNAQRLLEKTFISTEVVQVKNPDNVAAQNSESETLLRELRERLAEKMINLIRYR